MENNLNASYKKYQNLLFPIIAVLIGLALLGLVIIPQGLKIPATNAQIDSTRKSLAAINLKINQLNGIDVNQYQNNVNTSLISLPEDKDFPGIMILVFNLLKNNSLTLNGITFASQQVATANASASASGANTFVIKADVTGSKDSLANMISQLKSSPRIIKVDSISSSSSLSSTTLQITVGLDSFYQPIPATQTLDINQPVELPSQQDLDALSTIQGYQAANGGLMVEATAAAVPLGKTDPFQ